MSRCTQYINLFKDIKHFNRKISTDEEREAFLADLRWGKVPQCIQCASTRILTRKTEYSYRCLYGHSHEVTPAGPPTECHKCKENGEHIHEINLHKHVQRYKCNDCGLHYSTFTGTIFQDTRASLDIWFEIICAFCEGASNPSKVADRLNVPYKCVALIWAKLRKAVADENSRILKDKIQADEFITGPDPQQNMLLSYAIKDHKKAEKKLKEKFEEENPNEKYVIKPFGHQKIILNMLDSNGKAICKKIGISKMDLITDNILAEMLKHIEPSAIIILDEHPTHKSLKKLLKNVILIPHGKEIPLLDKDGNQLFDKKGKKRMKKVKTFADKEGNNTNALENLNKHQNAFLRRYFHVSQKYIQHYLDEFVFLNNYNDEPFFNKFLILIDKCMKTTATEAEIQGAVDDDPRQDKKWVKRKEEKKRKAALKIAA